ncbi:hypothetical protein [Geodermatophilus normandii]|uniref:hypothetical protein n=1 Tax=Geodermatophilus normandii TaxID=1137989 RepID=UPI001FE74787|nr:hypothetical protein [Geodermatophilus normandii]
MFGGTGFGGAGFGGAGFEADWFGLLGREVLRERRAALIAEACAWSVGLSDRPHHLRRRGRLVATGSTIGDRAATGQALSGEEDGRIELGDARPGSFQDALNAVDADGTVFADRFDREVVEPFVHETCLLAAERARRTRPGQWAELLDDLGEDPDDAEPADVVRAGEWEGPLRLEAEHLVLAALGGTPLLEVESEGLPLSLVRAAEAATRAAAAPALAEPEPDEGLAGALFLALAAVREADLPSPVPPADARALVAALLGQGLEPAEVAGVLPHLPLAPGTADRVAALLS